MGAREVEHLNLLSARSDFHFDARVKEAADWVVKRPFLDAEQPIGRANVKRIVDAEIELELVVGVEFDTEVMIPSGRIILERRCVRIERRPSLKRVERFIFVAVQNLLPDIFHLVPDGDVTNREIAGKLEAPSRIAKLRLLAIQILRTTDVRVIVPIDQIAGERACRKLDAFAKAVPVVQVYIDSAGLLIGVVEWAAKAGKAGVVEHHRGAPCKMPSCPAIVPFGKRFTARQKGLAMPLGLS